MCKILLSKEERKALVVLHSDASHGPWAYESDGDNGNFNVGIVLDDNDTPISGYVEDNTFIVVDVVAREVEGSPNAAFIVEAYNAFPRLLYGLEVLEARAEQAEDSLRESISKQDEMAAGIEKLAAANHALAERAQQAEAALESALQVNAVRQAEGIANILNGMMAGITGEKGSVRLELGGYHCPYCNEVSKTIEAATAHDATCPKHPAVIRAERAEAELARARAAGIEAMRRAEQAGTAPCPICGQSGHIGDCEED